MTEIDKDWCLRMAELEGDAEIGAGMPDHPLRAAMTDKSAPEQVELLPCPNPWCGQQRGYHVRIEGFALSIIRCGRCGLQGPSCDTEAEAIAAWNTRIQSQRPSPGVDVDLLKWCEDWLIREIFIPGDLASTKARSLAEYLAENVPALSAIAAMPDERKLIVDWLRSKCLSSTNPLHHAADAIERGDHISATVEG